ncbi:MAG TPA: precorrin-6y C5,15-methyltransferase (decarboxylating) subunit CbiE [Candidatus Competibacteraceae bacterium]|nr:precorrin-6y C5,15-methyltransferase (decarboxylating) subunit CbiE [Candidatus Competibacteraceae bacterium]
MTLAWSGPPLHVIGMGIEAGDTLSNAARTALEQAEVIIAASRYRAIFRGLRAECYDYPSPLQKLWPLLQERAGKRIVLLASGDPLFYGIGVTLAQRLGTESIRFHPNVSSMQAAFARIGKPWQQARMLSLHGRPLASLKAVLQANRLYALLTDRDSHPNAIAALLQEVGFGKSVLWVAEDLGMPEERVRRFQAMELTTESVDFSALNVVILETRGWGGLLPEFPGIPDEMFITDDDQPGKGMLSKREVRLTILSLLSPRAGEVGWDVGAGCGGVSVEWARWNLHGTVYAVECHQERLRCLMANRERFGVLNNLHIIAGKAPEALAELPDPDVVFIGGSKGKLDDLLEAGWRRLSPGGRLVASAVTEDSKMDLYRFADDRPAGWTEISVARGDRLAGQRVLRPYLPVLLLRLEKPWE